MDELVKMISYLRAYGHALEDGINKFSSALPLFTKQHITRKANQKLNSTKNAYLQAVSVKMIDFVLVVELDRDSWLANAVESGVGQFNMKAGHLQSSKAKLSKEGYRYLRIPIGKDPNKPAPIGERPEKSQEIQRRIVDVLIKPKYGLRKVKRNPDGSVYETQKVMTHDPMLQGFYRTRRFDTAEDYYGGKKKPTWQFVLFRTMSENPKSKSNWDHPGIQPAHIFRDTEKWLHQAVGQLLSDFIQSEVDTLNQRFGES